jgi:uncharacterized membrane protein YhaH (DUF805 family)
MAQANPYAVPNAPVNDIHTDEGFGEIKLLTAKGRMGRLRYFLHGMLVGLGGMLLLLLASLLFTISPILGGIVVALIYIAMIVISVFLTIQRCHDFNSSGWMSLLLLVPFAPLLFYFIPGTKATNEYGLQPPANSKGVIAGAIILPIAMIFIMGILASIALPAYQDYIDRAKAAAIEQNQ